MNKILCSTGAFGSKLYPDAEKIIELSRQINADGFELMITKAWAEDPMGFAEVLKASNVCLPIGHLRKSDIVKFYESGEIDLVKQGHQNLKEDCEILSAFNIDKAVMHLWGWPDNNFENIMRAYKETVKIASSLNIELLIETIPTRSESVTKRMEQVVEANPDCRFTADVRHLRYCNMQDEIFNVDWIWSENRIAHVHISDCGINEKGQVMVRPALQPGEGIIDFDIFFRKLKEKNYSGAITMEASGLDHSTDILRVDKINNSIDLIRNGMSK